MEKEIVNNLKNKMYEIRNTPTSLDEINKALGATNFADIIIPLPKCDGIKLSDYVNIINKVIEQEGDISANRLFIDTNEFKLLIGDNVYQVNDYKNNIINKVLK